MIAMEKQFYTIRGVSKTKPFYKSTLASGGHYPEPLRGLLGCYSFEVENPDDRRRVYSYTN